MIRRTGRGNRIALLLIGLALLLGGAAGLLRGLNVWPGWLGAPHALIIDKATRHWVAGQPWFWPTVAAVSVLVFLLALWWLAAQGRPGRCAGWRWSRTRGAARPTCPPVP